MYVILQPCKIVRNTPLDRVAGITDTINPTGEPIEIDASGDLTKIIPDVMARAGLLSFQTGGCEIKWFTNMGTLMDRSVILYKDGNTAPPMQHPLKQIDFYGENYSRPAWRNTAEPK